MAKIMNPEVKQAHPLFACSKCFRRFPYEEIFTSNEDMICCDCRNATIKLKCLYCRSEFQQSSKSSSTSVCPKCANNLKLYGKPSACTLCSINAAFKSDKCHRCTTSEYKYGHPIKCEICQQMCAFDRADHRVDGKLHCWLCKLSYKRALAKAKKSDNDKHRGKKRSADESSLKPIRDLKMSSQSASNNRNNSNSQRPELPKSGLSDIPEKIPKTANSGLVPNNSDHVVAMTQLREQIATLQKKLQQKDNHLLQKDKEITEWKSKLFSIENEMRNKQKDQERIFEAKIDVMNKKNQMQLKEIAQLSKLQKRNAAKEPTKEKEKENSSGTDSPSTN